MYNLCYRMVGNKEVAEDALQEAFLNAFTKLDSFQGKSSFGAWLKKIVINKCLSHIKKQRMIFEPFQDHTIEEKEENTQSGLPDLAAEKIHKAIQQLPQGSRVVFTLYQLEGYDHKEISSILNISVSTSKSQFHRAKKLLKKELCGNKLNHI